MEFPATTDISYVVYEVRLFISYSFTFSVVLLSIREFSFFNLIQKREMFLYLPRSLGSSQDTSALLDVMLVTVRFVGLSGTKPIEKSTNIICVNFEICDK